MTTPDRELAEVLDRSGDSVDVLTDVVERLATLARRHGVQITITVTPSDDDDEEVRDDAHGAGA